MLSPSIQKPTCKHPRMNLSGRLLFNLWKAFFSGLLFQSTESLKKEAVIPSNRREGGEIEGRQFIAYFTIENKNVTNILK